MEAPRFSSIHNGYQTEAGGLQSQSGSLALFLEQWLGLIRRQSLVIISIIVFVIGIGFAQLMTTPPVYTSHSRVMLDTNRASPFQQQNGPIIYFQVMDLSSIMTQQEVLKSD